MEATTFRPLMGCETICPTDCARYHGRKRCSEVIQSTYLQIYLNYIYTVNLNYNHDPYIRMGWRAIKFSRLHFTFLTNIISRYLIDFYHRQGLYSYLCLHRAYQDKVCFQRTLPRRGMSSQIIFRGEYKIPSHRATSKVVSIVVFSHDIYRYNVHYCF